MGSQVFWQRALEEPGWIAAVGPDGTAHTAGDLLAIVSELGLKAGHTEWSRPAEADYASFAELVDVTRRRLCLPPERASEVEAALLDMGIIRERPGDLGSSGREVVTIWWEGTT